MKERDVKKPLLSATIVAALVTLLCAVGAAHAQNATVAIIDMGYIFKQHAGFQAASAEMRKVAQAAEAEFKGKKETIQKMMQKIETYNKGSAEYKQLEQEITKAQADMQVEFKLAQKSFVERESKIYYEVYQQVLEEVKRYAESAGIVLVLRFNGDPADKNNPEEIGREVNNLIVYYHQAIDITPIIRDRLNGQTPRPGAPATQVPASARDVRPGVPPRPR
jgi:Skp family chaperone for outer membrane proteins